MHCGRLSETRTDEYGIVAVPEEIIDGEGASYCRMGTYLYVLELQMPVLEVIENPVGKAEGRDTVPHDASDLVAGFKDGDVISPAGKQDGNGQACRT